MSRLGTPEILLIMLLALLLFGGKRLPEVARGLGRSLRIFKAETKGLMAEEPTDPPAGRDTAAGKPAEPPAASRE